MKFPEIFIQKYLDIFIDLKSKMVFFYNTNGVNGVNELPPHRNVPVHEPKRTPRAGSSESRGQGAKSSEGACGWLAFTYQIYTPPIWDRLLAG